MLYQHYTVQAAYVLQDIHYLLQKYNEVGRNTVELTRLHFITSVFH